LHRSNSTPSCRATAVGLVEEQEPQAAAGAARPQEVRVALPLGEHDHHDRGADANRLAGRQPGRARRLPVARGLAPDLDGELEVLAVVEQALATGAPTAVAAEDLVQRLLDRDGRRTGLWASPVRAQIYSMRSIGAARSDPADAAEVDAVELRDGPADLTAGAPELDIDAARDVSGPQIVLLTRGAALGTSRWLRRRSRREQQSSRPATAR
jgi:hypothetical protein